MGEQKKRFLNKTKTNLNQRAQAVTNCLAANNISSMRLTSLGLGESQPKYSNENSAGRNQNRRVEFAIKANEKMRREVEQQKNKDNWSLTDSQIVTHNLNLNLNL